MSGTDLWSVRSVTTVRKPRINAKESGVSPAISAGEEVMWCVARVVYSRHCRCGKARVNNSRHAYTPQNFPPAAYRSGEPGQ
jgi:hypothetical protein